MAQLVARDIWDVEAAGSNPVTPTSLGKLERYLGKKPRNHAVFCISKARISKITKRGCKMGVLAFWQEVNHYNNEIEQT